MTYLSLQISQYEASIVCFRQSLARYEALYDSLRSFRSLVVDAKEAFADGNTKKLATIASLSAAVSNCVTAERYTAGMEKVLNKVGVAAVAAAFSALVSSVDIKLKEYSNMISSLEWKIQSLQSAVQLLEAELAASLNQA